MTTQSDTSIDTYLERVDRQLAIIASDSDKATFLNMCIEGAEDRARRLERTLDTRGGNAFQITEIICALNARHADVVARLEASAKAAQATFDNSDAGLITAFRERREAMEPAEQTMERV